MSELKIEKKSFIASLLIVCLLSILTSGMVFGQGYPITITETSILLTDGTNPMLGNLNMTGYSVLGIGNNETSVSNGDWFVHGLAVTPDAILLTPRSNATVWVNDRNSTHFQCGVSSGSVDLDWAVFP